MVEVDVKLTAADIFDYLLMHVYNSAWGNFLTVLGTLMVLRTLITGAWGWLVLGVIILLGMPVALYVKSSRQCGAEEFCADVHYRMEEDALTVTRTVSERKESTQFLWADMYKAVSTNRSIILYTSKNEAEIFPKQDLGDQRAAVIEMISTHMAPDKVKIKQ